MGCISSKFGAANPNVRPIGKRRSSTWQAARAAQATEEEAELEDLAQSNRARWSRVPLACHVLFQRLVLGMSHVMWVCFLNREPSHLYGST